MCSSHGFPAQKIERQKAEEERQTAEEVGRRREARGLTESQERREGGVGGAGNDQEEELGEWKRKRVI